MNKIVLRNIVVYTVLIGIGFFLTFDGQTLSKDFPEAMRIVGVILIAISSFRVFIYSKLAKDDEIKK